MGIRIIRRLRRSRRPGYLTSWLISNGSGRPRAVGKVTARAAFAMRSDIDRIVRAEEAGLTYPARIALLPSALKRAATCTREISRDLHGSFSQQTERGCRVSRNRLCRRHRARRVLDFRATT